MLLQVLVIICAKEIGFVPMEKKIKKNKKV